MVASRHPPSSNIQLPPRSSLQPTTTTSNDQQLQTMASTPTHSSIQSLLQTSAYDPSIIPQLESYVRAQLSSASTSLSSSSDAQYSFDANRTLIKLYQFFPDREDEGVIAMTTFLALMNWPDVEVGCLQCLVGERVMGSEPCATLIRWVSAMIDDAVLVFAFVTILRAPSICITCILN